MRRLLTFAALAVASVARAQSPAPIATYQGPSTGFIDDAFALRDDGKAIAYVVTDGASSASLRMTELGGVQSEIAGLPTTTVALHWLTNDRVLVVSRDPAHQTVTGQVYTAQGATKEKLGPADAIALANVGGKPAVVAYTRIEKKTIDHQLVALDRTTWKVIAKKSLRADADGRIAYAGGPFKPLWWHDGYTVVATLKAGEFDKAKDMRRPDRFAQLEVFANKLRDEHEIEDVLAFTKVATDHNAHPGEDAFAHFSDDRHQLLVTDGLNEYPITIARELVLYDPDTLGYQALDADRIAISLTIDPVNPAALRRKKADPDDLDFYLVDRHTHAASQVLRLAGQGRPSHWRIAGQHVAVLRKSKGFDRGGVSLEVYELPVAQSAATR